MITLVEDIQNGKTITAIAKERGVDRSTIYNWMRSDRLNHQKLKFNHDFFEKIDCEEKAYWLGFIMADGCVSVTQQPKLVVALNKKDKSHLEKWHKAIQSCRKINCWRDTVISAHYSTKMCNDLIALGCIPRKSLKLHFPLLREDLTRHFVRGYFDGDGCISYHGKSQKTPHIRFTVIGTKSFLNTLQKILQTSNKLSKVGRTYSLAVNGNKKPSAIFEWMYDDATIFLDRKREIYHSYL